MSLRIHDVGLKILRSLKEGHINNVEETVDVYCDFEGEEDVR